MARGRHLHHLRTQQALHHGVELGGFQLLHGGPHLFLLVQQNALQGGAQLGALPRGDVAVQPFRFLLLHHIPCQRQLELSEIFKPQFVAQAGDRRFRRAALPCQFRRGRRSRPLYICKDAVRNAPLGAVKLDAGAQRRQRALRGSAHKQYLLSCAGCTRILRVKPVYQLRHKKSIFSGRIAVISAFCIFWKIIFVEQNLSAACGGSSPDRGARFMGQQPSFSASLRPMSTPMTEAIIKPRVQPEESPRQCRPLMLVSRFSSILTLLE